MNMLKPVSIALFIVCFCSCKSTKPSPSDSISDISNISTIYDGGSTRAHLTFRDDSVWCLAYNRNLDDKDHNVKSYNCLTVTQIKPYRGDSSQLPKGGKEEMEWLRLLRGFQDNNTWADKEILKWATAILKEKKYK